LHEVEEKIKCIEEEFNEVRSFYFVLTLMPKIGHLGKAHFFFEGGWVYPGAPG